jgi:L-ascorbate metabolism protein UlaG (beta-lactamase superfamily)
MRTPEITRRQRCRRTGALALAALAACTGPRSALHVQPPPPIPSPCVDAHACSDTVAVTYLGVDGFLIRRGTSVVMTSPLFTHRGMFATVFNFTFRSDTAGIERALTTLGVRGDLKDVSTILAGHSHYDHLLDVPYIAHTYLRAGAQVLGSPSMKHILAGDPGALRHALAIPADDVGTHERVGKWIYAADGQSRVMALASSHAPNWWKLTLAPGTVDADRRSLPRSVWGWKLGEVYAYIVDFIRADSTPEFRFFFQDAVSEPKYNALPPFTRRDVHQVDLAIVCAGNSSKAPNYPSVMLRNLQPARVIVGHWDDFFAPWSLDPDVVARTNTKQLERRLNEYVRGRWVTPLPGTVMRFAFSVGG